MQPRRQRTHYLPLTLTSYLPPSLLIALLNSPWPTVTNVQDQMCAFWHNTFILNALSQRKKKEEKGIKETISFVIIHTIQIQLSHHNE